MNVLAITNASDVVTTILTPVGLATCDDCGATFFVLENGVSWVVLEDLGAYPMTRTLGGLKRLQAILSDVLVRQTDESLGLIAEHNLGVVERELVRFEEKLLRKGEKDVL